MGVFEHFPYVNYHELNLSWILRKLKELEDVIGSQIVDIVARAGVAENAQAISDLTETVETNAETAHTEAAAAQTTADSAVTSASSANTRITELANSFNSEFSPTTKQIHGDFFGRAYMSSGLLVIDLEVPIYNKSVRSATLSNYQGTDAAHMSVYGTDGFTELTNVITNTALTIGSEYLRIRLFTSLTTNIGNFKPAIINIPREQNVIVNIVYN